MTSKGAAVDARWIEARLMEDSRVGACLVVKNGDANVALFLVPSPTGAAWFARAAPADVTDLVRQRCAGAPEEAMPKRRVVLSPA